MTGRYVHIYIPCMTSMVENSLLTLFQEGEARLDVRNVYPYSRYDHHTLDEEDGKRGPAHCLNLKENFSESKNLPFWHEVMDKYIYIYTWPVNRLLWTPP